MYTIPDKRSDKRSDKSSVASMQNIGMDMVKYLPNEKMQLERPSDCALGFLTSLRKVLAPDLVCVCVNLTSSGEQRKLEPSSLTRYFILAWIFL